MKGESQETPELVAFERNTAMEPIDYIAQLADALASRMRINNENDVPNITFSAFALLYLERHAKLRVKNWKDLESRLRLHVLPRIGHKHLADVSTNDLVALQAAVHAGQRPHSANRCMEIVSQMYRLAREWGYFPEGRRLPTEKIVSFVERSRERFVDESEMPRLAAALETIEKAPHLYVLFWLYLLTGLRRDEIRMAKWCDVDLEKKQLNVAGTGTKSGRAICQPLSDLACALIETLPKSSAYIFCAPGRTKPVNKGSVYRCWHRVRILANLADVRIHDLRRTTGSWLAKSGYSLLLIAKTLNHGDTRATKVYARLANSDVREALEFHSQKMSGFPKRVKGYQPKQSNNLNSEIVETMLLSPIEPVVTAQVMPTLANAIDSVKVLHLKSFFWLFMLTGLTQKELLALRWNDVNLERRVVLIRADSSHSGNDFEQHISTASVLWFQQLHLLRPSGDVFAPAGKWKAVGKKTVEQSWKAVCRRASLDHLDLTSLRRKLRSLLIASGVSPALIAQSFNRGYKIKVNGKTVYCPCSNEHKAKFSSATVVEAIESMNEKIMTLAKHNSVDRLTC